MQVKCPSAYQRATCLHPSNLWSGYIIQTPPTGIFCSHPVFATQPAYKRNLPEDKHEVGKKNTQRIERKHLNLRTKIKRLARKTIRFSKLEEMHNLVIGLFINRYEFGLSIQS